MALDEGRVLKRRKGLPLDAELKPAGPECAFDDHVHSANSYHYLGLADDMELYIDGQWVSGDHPAWHDLADYWKKLDPVNTWGGDFKTGTRHDLNHFSRGER